MNVTEKINDRKKGALYGLAIGDALGAAVEFSPPGTFEPVTGYRGGGLHGLKPGEWTDDTSMALALAFSLSSGWDLDHQLECWCQWKYQGRWSVNGKCFDIGNATNKALHRHTYQELSWHECGLSEDHACGNGSIMRLAPIPILLAEKGPVFVGHAAALSGSCTHSNPLCLRYCETMGRMMAKYIILGKRGNATTLAGPGKGTGYVIDCFESAMWAFFSTDSFEDAVLKAVNLGNDADTTGAVCGQIAGSYYGLSGIPEHLVDGLARKDMIDRALAELGVK